MNSLRKTKELVVGRVARTLLSARQYPPRLCGNARLARRGGAKRSQRCERARLSGAPPNLDSRSSPRRNQTSRPRSRQLLEAFDLDASPNRMYDRRNPRRSCPRHAGIPAKEMLAMTPKERFSRASGPLLLFVLILPLASTASAEWNEKVLYSFQGIPDGAVPAGGVVFDKQGNLYGATGDGGASTCEGPGECGTVYQLKPPAQKGGAWTETVLYIFKGHAQNDGATPEGGLVIDQAGNLYGTTGYGGSGPCLLLGAAVGCGAVYELSPPAKQGDPWKEKVLYSFQGGKDGFVASGDLVFDRAGNLYVATLFGGGKGTTCDSLYGGQCGTVFKLSPPKTKNGKWTEKVLHSFAGGTDGAIPNGGLVFDSSGTIYGTTPAGGNEECKGSSGLGCGTAFQLNPPKRAGGPRTERILHRFTGGNDGAGPNGGLIFGANGLIYGSGGGGGSGNGFGVVFRLTQAK